MLILFWRSILCSMLPIRISANPLVVTVELNQVPINMEVDTGHLFC